MSTHHLTMQYADDAHLRVVVSECGTGDEVASKKFAYPSQHDDMRDYVLAAVAKYDCDNKQHMIDLFNDDDEVTLQ